ncbi:MAG: TraR/DksA C4-type zinc finger protein [Rhodospirillales bacterium]|nr:TraR/DksA C4-type zinc finger protein [Rhodospirillales bacterium]
MTVSEFLDLQALKRQLLVQRDELERLSAISAESRAAVELDQTVQGRLSRMDAIQQQEMAKETERRRAIERQRIDAALKRMEDGDYGYCVKCDEEIVAARLNLDPATPTCINCAY